jgi:hypothetical protein
MLLLSGVTDGVVFARPTLVLFQIKKQFDFLISPECQTITIISMFNFFAFAKLSKLACKVKVDE